MELTTKKAAEMPSSGYWQKNLFPLLKMLAIGEQIAIVIKRLQQLEVLGEIWKQGRYGENFLDTVKDP
jgi:hypothetical protein